MAVLQLEENEIRNLLLGIMEGYKDTVISPFSYFSPISISENGSTSRKRDEEDKERKRREQMNDKFSVLQSMVPSLFKIKKPSKEEIVDKTVKYINSLKEEIHKLESLKKQPSHESKDARTQVLSECTNQNSSVEVTLFHNATFLAIEAPFRPGLMTDIVYVLDKHQTEVLEARFSVNHQNFLTFAGTLMVPNQHGCGIAIRRMKEELLRL